MTVPPSNARFITFEGIDGAGKTTHLRTVQHFLEASGERVCVTREPGGTRLGEAIRALFLAHSMHAATEALLVFAARREHLEEVVWPALARGEWVLCDRFTDATRAYQGAGRGLGMTAIDALAAWVHPDFAPVLTFLFDLSPAAAQARISDRDRLDRFEREAQTFHERVRNAYLEQAAREPERFCVLDATLAKSVVATTIESRVGELVARLASPA